MSETGSATGKIARSGNSGLLLSKKGLRTRERLLKAAREIFRESGYEGARVSDMTQRAELSNGAFYRYFTDKRDLLVTLLDGLFERMYLLARAPWQPADPPESIYLTTLRYFEEYQASADLYKVMIEAAQVDSAIERRWEEARRLFFDRIAHALSRGQESGAVRSDIDPQFAAALLGGMTEHYAYLAYVLKREPDRDVEAMSRELAMIWSYGVFLPDVSDK